MPQNSGHGSDPTDEARNAGRGGSAGDDQGRSAVGDFSGLGRFAEPSLLILSSLAGGAKHGYAMIEDIETMAGVRLGPGTLYGALARLERSGLIEPLPTEDRRRPYRLTGVGATILRAQLAQLERLASEGLGRLRQAEA